MGMKELIRRVLASHIGYNAATARVVADEVSNVVNLQASKK